MGVKTKDFTKSLTELLPEGLTEEVVNKIADLVKDKIDETIKDKMGSLNDQVRVFLRSNIEKLKEQAIKELELENEAFRNAKMFETVKAMFAIEQNPSDEKNAISALTESTEKQEDKITVLVSEVDRLVKENLALKRKTTLLMDKNTKLEESVVSLKEVKEGNSDKKLSDRAVIVSASNFKIREDNSNKEGAAKKHQNEFLTEGVLAANKKLNIGKK